jgi:putative methionine-R-sulfoxide reductase with GAF domain
MRNLAEPGTDGDVIFIVDAETDPEEISHLGDVYYEFTPEQKHMVQTLEKPRVDDAFYTDRWGSWLTAYAPIFGPGGHLDAVLGIDMAVEDVLNYERQFLWIALTILALLMPVIASIGWLLGKRLAQPISLLIEGTERFSHGDLDHRVIIRGKDEFSTLASRFNSMADQLRGLIGTLEQGVADRTRALETSTEVSRRLSTILDQDALVKAVVEEVKSAFNYYHAHIYLYDEAEEYLVMVGGTGEAGEKMLSRGHKLQRGKGLVGRAVETDQVVLVPDTAQDPDWLPNTLLPETKSEIAVPINAGGRVIGVLDVQQNTVNGLTEQDSIVLQSIASQVGIAVQNARAYNKAQQQAERETVINVIGQKIQVAPTVEDVLQIAVRELGAALGSHRASIQLGLLPKDGNQQ